MSVQFSLLLGHLQLSCWDSPNSAASLLKINNNVSCPLTNHRLMLAWTLGLQMDGIHPKFVLSKRFPVHAAIEQLNLHALKVRARLQISRSSVELCRICWLLSRTPGSTLVGSWPTRTSLCCTRPAPTGLTVSRQSWTSWSFVSLWELLSMIWTVLDKLHCSMLSGMFW